jgi:ubiquinol-cytochrome c reductase iron-sulfur subunit
MTQTHDDIDSRAGFDASDPRYTRFDLVREGARRDGVEIVHYAQRFPVPGTKAERRVERTIALCLLITGVSGLAFVVAFIWWPWEYELGTNPGKFYNQILGVTLGLALLGIGAAVVIWGRKLLPEEVAVQDRHDGPSARDEQLLTGATIVNMADETGITRRPLLKGALVLGLAPVALVPLVSIIGGFIKDPHKGNPFYRTGFDPANNNGKPVRLMRDDLTPVRPEEVSAGGQITVFPAIPGGNTNEHADSPTLLIHLRPKDAEETRRNLVSDNQGSMWGDYVAFSKICTHAGCPASLYEQQTNRLLCPCHQSQFQITDNARPIFGPATRRLPMLPLDVDGEGFFVAKSDYKSPIGPGFWERS